MTAERNDLMPNQKLEWVTPNISLMEAGDTDGKQFNGRPVESVPDFKYGVS
jgi:hypothetical protein